MSGLIRPAQLPDVLAWREPSTVADHMRFFDRVVAGAIGRAPACDADFWERARFASSDVGPLESQPYVALAALHRDVLVGLADDARQLVIDSLSTTSAQVLAPGSVVLDTSTTLGTALTAACLAETSRPPSRVAPPDDPHDAVSAVSAALHVLHEHGGAAYDLVQAAVRRLLVRSVDRVGGRPSFTWSAPITIGLVSVGNVHLAAPAELIENIVHEAIHSVVYVSQLAEPMFGTDARDDVGPPIAVASPWTGNPLHPRAFVHATLVWFAIANLWSRAELAAAVGPDEADRRCLSARRGLERDRWLAVAEPVLAALTEPWRAALSSLPH